MAFFIDHCHDILLNNCYILLSFGFIFHWVLFKHSDIASDVNEHRFFQRTTCPMNEFIDRGWIFAFMNHKTSVYRRNPFTSLDVVRPFTEILNITTKWFGIAVSLSFHSHPINFSPSQKSYPCNHYIFHNVDIRHTNSNIMMHNYFFFAPSSRDSMLSLNPFNVLIS